MGLQSHVRDCSSDSILIHAIVAIASFVSYIRSLAFSLLHFTGLTRFYPDEDYEVHGEIFVRVGSSLASLVLLTEQLNLNRARSVRFEGEPGLKCMVCLSGLKEGEQVRRLACRHVFHKDCFDGWLEESNFSCPLCRMPVVEERRVESTRRRVGRDLINFFSIRC